MPKNTPFAFTQSGGSYENPDIAHYSWYPEVKGYFDDFYNRPFPVRCSLMKNPEYRKRFIKKIKWCNLLDKCPNKDKVGADACVYVHDESEFRLPFCAFNEFCTKPKCDFYHTGDCPDIIIPKKPEVTIIIESKDVSVTVNPTQQLQPSSEQQVPSDLSINELICLANKFGVTLSLNENQGKK